MVRIDLGCGSKKKKEYIGVDIYPQVGVDIVCDISQASPFRDNSVDEVYSHMLLEHVSNLVKVMEEIYRVCKEGAKVYIDVPHFSGFSAYYEYHKRFFRTNSFKDFTLENEDIMKVSNKCNFKILKNDLHLLTKNILYFPQIVRYIVEPFANRHKEFYERTGLCNLFPAFEIKFILEVIK